MKLNLKPNHLKYAVLGAGGLALALRTVLYTTGMDHKGLLVPGHWAAVCLWILTALSIFAVFYFTRSVQGPDSFSDAFPTSVPAALGSLAVAAAIVLRTLKQTDADTLALITTVLGLVSAAAMVYGCYCRLVGKSGTFLVYVALCLYLASQLVSRYRTWCADPQLQDYFFQIFATIALVLSAYQHAAFAAGKGSHRWLWGLSLATVFLCCAASGRSEESLFFLACGFWAFTGLSVLSQRPRRNRPQLQLEEDA